MRKNLIRMILLLALSLPFSGCLFSKYPNLTMEIKRLQKNFKTLNADYKPVLDKDGKVVGKPAHRPFGDDEEENEESRKNRQNLFDESDKLCEDMVAASKGGD